MPELPCFQDRPAGNAGHQVDRAAASGHAKDEHPRRADQRHDNSSLRPQGDAGRSEHRLVHRASLCSKFGAEQPVPDRIRRSEMLWSAVPD